MTLIDFLNSVPSAVWAAAWTLLGAVILKVVDNWLSKAQESRLQNKDFRETINDLRERLDKVEEEVTEWRTKYYAAQEEIASLRLSLIRAGISVPQTSVTTGDSS